MTESSSPPGPTTRMKSTPLQSRAWEGILSLLLWVLVAALGRLVRFPGWAIVAFPVPSLLVALDALSPCSLFVRWKVGFGPTGTRWLTSVLIGISLALAWVTLTAPTPGTDQPPVITCAAQDLWHGLDPYDTYEPQCLARLHLTGVGATPLEAGPFRDDTRYPSSAQVEAALRRDQREGGHAGFPAFGYPPDAALLILPVAFMGWIGISLWVAAVTVLLLVAIWGRKPTWAVAPALAWQVAALSVLWVLFGWNPEELSYLLLALAFARIDKARVSSLAMAAAVCTNPLSWPGALVYLVILARLPEPRRRWIWLGAGVAIGVLPWMIWDHGLLGQLWGFVTLKEFPLGASLGYLARLPAKSHLVYTIGLLAGFAGCAFVAWRWPAWRWTMAVMIYASFLLSWRGLIDYYTPALWLSPAVLLGASRLAKGLDSSPRQAGLTEAVAAT